MSLPPRRSLPSRLRSRLGHYRVILPSNLRLFRLASQVAIHSPKPVAAPVIFFRASSGLLWMSQNNAFHLLTSLSLRLQGVPVVHFTCQSGMSRCVLGTNRERPQQPPPCSRCVMHTRTTDFQQPKHWFTYDEDRLLEAALQGLGMKELEVFEFDNLPLGGLVMPSMRWILRRHHLDDDEPTRFLMREYLLSAYNLIQKFAVFLDQVKPQAVVVFNGMFYPEAAARYVALKRGIRVISHEVAHLPYTAFFTDGEATAYPVSIPPIFELNEAQNRRLDAYLEQRFQGNFTMAGIRFWHEIRGLDEDLINRLSSFKQVVTVFTNVVFDTSQVHANVLYPHMFAWLDDILAIIRAHPETFFVIRAHPDEMRLYKESRESVGDWAKKKRLYELPNVLFIGPTEPLSSYALIQRSKFVMVYNSSIGLEATLLGAPVLCAGKARYTQYPTVFFPLSAQTYIDQVEGFLAADQIDIPIEFKHHARRFLYYQLYLTALPFTDYLGEHFLPGFVTLRPFNWKKLLPTNSLTMQTIIKGILERQPFILEDHLASQS